MSIDLSACPQASLSILLPFYSKPVSLHHSFIAFSSPPSIPISFALLPSHLCGALCAFVLTVLLVQFIPLTHLLPVPLPTTTSFFFFFLLSSSSYFHLPSLSRTLSHALSISCGLSGLQSRVMGDRRGRLRTVTLICRG